jgi:CDP-diacylglycerol--serine O-phosphatidyltransferase
MHWWIRVKTSKAFLENKKAAYKLLFLSLWVDHYSTEPVRTYVSGIKVMEQKHNSSENNSDTNNSYAKSDMKNNANDKLNGITGETSTNPGKKRSRGIYLLPNLFTTAALFGGFYAIIAAMNGKFEAAAVAIFIAMILDGVDGRVARMTHTQSDFGAEYDSLSDMISFGIAPALVMYTWSLSLLGKIGWIAAFVYVVGAALRLARFNTQVGHADKRYFIGLPSPSAAGFTVGFVWLCVDYGVTGESVRYLAFLMTIAAGILMVSGVKYRSFKDLDLKNKVPFVTILVMVLIFISIVYQPPSVLFAGFGGYTLIALLMYVLRIVRKKNTA